MSDAYREFDIENEENSREDERDFVVPNAIQPKYKVNDVVWVPIPGVLKPAIVTKVTRMGLAAVYEVEFCLGEYWEIEEFSENHLKPYFPRREISGTEPRPTEVYRRQAAA